MELVLKSKSVNVSNLAPQLYFALGVACAIFGKHGLQCIVTSAQDSEHGPHSKHYQYDLSRKCEASDLRTKHIPVGEGLKHTIKAELRDALSQYGFQVILENEGGDNEHFHVEYDPAQTGKRLEFRSLA